MLIIFGAEMTLSKPFSEDVHRRDQEESDGNNGAGQPIHYDSLGFVGHYTEEIDIATVEAEAPR